MGLFDSMVGAAMGQLQQDGLGQALGGLLSNDGPVGGLDGLQARFHEAGLGGVIQSWIGSGQNLPISAEQLQSVLGSDTVKQIAGQLGLDPEHLTGQLASLLPGVVDGLTPNGQVPDGGVGGHTDLLGMLGGLLRK